MGGAFCTKGRLDGEGSGWKLEWMKKTGREADTDENINTIWDRNNSEEVKNINFTKRFSECNLDKREKQRKENKRAVRSHVMCLQRRRKKDF